MPVHAKQNDKSMPMISVRSKRSTYLCLSGRTCTVYHTDLNRESWQSSTRFPVLCRVSLLSQDYTKQGRVAPLFSFLFVPPATAAEWSLLCLYDGRSEQVPAHLLRTREGVFGEPSQRTRVAFPYRHSGRRSRGDLFVVPKKRLPNFPIFFLRRG